ncbi:MAG TPA: class I SAM-dependent methyltransferase [Solirubrobacteraceae bacterium]|nr:class I SAM-dependent methyltransferase [Solirubrobacteraceae bacterium]
MASSTGSDPITDRVCPACGGALVAWRVVPGSDPALPGRYELARCTRCGTAVTLAPAPLEAHESGAYGGGAPRGSGLAAPILRAFARRRLAMLGAAGAQPPGRLLDIGAGRGRFVAEARAAGWYAHGIEPSQRGIEGAKALGIELQRGGIEDSDVPAGSLDAATLWHVLEHLDEPGPAVARVASWLRPGALLLVGVPNLASLQARAGGGRWYHLDVPRHRTHFTVAGLHALLRAHGLEPVATHHVLLEHNPFGLWQSVVSRVTRVPSWLYHALKRNASLRSSDAVVTLALLPLAPVALAVEALFGLLRRGGTVAVVARRRSG